MAVFAVPGDLATPTGGYAYARRILQALPDLVHLLLPGHPDLRETTSRLAAVPAGEVLLIDGLALGTLPAWCLDQVRAPVIALVHHPLCLETGLSEASRSDLFESERQALARCAHIVATSAATARQLTEMFAVPSGRLTIAEPGTDPAERAPRAGIPPHLLAVGAVVPRKGYDDLIAALCGLSGIGWRFSIVGSLDRDADTVRRVQDVIDRNGLAGRVTLAGAVDSGTLDRLYASADIFVTASHHEGYGMAVAEAMARGLPLVASIGGALAETVPVGAALTCRPGDVAGLRAALHRMLADRAVRDGCADAAWIAGQALPRWTGTAARIGAVIETVALTTM